MRSTVRNILLLSALVLVAFATFRCGGSDTDNVAAKKVAPGYRNLGDSARYVGMDQCRLCHQDIYNSFLQTGMGQSFEAATKTKSAAKFDQSSVIHDTHLNFSYHPYWDNEKLKILEFRMAGKDTIHKRIEAIDYIIGSGQHTNSHITHTNGYLCQAPMTFYTQRGKWDLPPGFENGDNTRFSRKIGLECMSCHNAYPDFKYGSENKYESVPNGINCERCHGPGSIHVREKSLGIKVDTSQYIDYTIVNPGKLPIDLQFDVCQRCHLQGNAVLKEGKSFFDFKPGMKLSDVMTVFMPRYEGQEDQFIMASHADRLKMSDCFIKTFKPEETKGSLRPYKNALTCVTCHDPHVSVKQTGGEVFNNACKNCHGEPQTSNVKHQTCSESLTARAKMQDNCVSCHMPKSGSIDIPHVSVTDHFIRKPAKTEDLAAVKKFIGLYAINEADPSSKVKAEAYMNQLEKFDLKNYALLDSARRYLRDGTAEEVRENFAQLVRLYFLKGDHARIAAYVDRAGKDYLLKKLSRKSWDNADAWTCYRTGEAVKDHKLDFYKRAAELAPLNYEFANKYGSALYGSGNKEEGMQVFANIVKENPKYVPALSNLGYCYYERQYFEKAEALYLKAIELDPDYERAVFNCAEMLARIRQGEKAGKILRNFLRSHPDHVNAQLMLQQIDKMKNP